MDDRMVNLLSESLRKNRSLTEINISSNRISIVGIERLLLTIRDENSTVTILNISDQISGVGYQGEMKIAELLESCKTISKFGYTFKNAAARLKADRAVSQNSFALRKQRSSLKTTSEITVKIESDEGLPSGWVKLGPIKMGEGDGVAYKNTVRGITQFRHPGKPIPKGWSTHFDDEQRAYFVHRKTRTVSWFIEADQALPSELKNFEN